MYLHWHKSPNALVTTLTSCSGQLVGKWNIECALSLLVHYSVWAVWGGEIPMLPVWGLVTLRLLVTDVTETSRTNPLRAILGELRDQAWTNCHHLSLGHALLLQYHREPFKAWPKLSLYPTKRGNRALVKEVVVRRGRSEESEGAWEPQDSEQRKRGRSGRVREKNNNIFLDFMAGNCLYTLLKE